MSGPEGMEVEPGWDLRRESWLGSRDDFKIPDQDSQANFLRVVELSTSGRSWERSRALETWLPS